jgi:hypothetical protein
MINTAHYVYCWLISIAQKKRKDIADCQPGEETLIKKKRLDDTSGLTSPKGKGKMKANNDILPRILSGYEDEITCPMYVCLFYSNCEN